MSENKEHMVEESAFLVSKTDLKGRITYCNEAFLKIVGAKQAEVLGKPHNIIRHPDMPRAVFKLLWERIKNREEIFAYVKNKSFDGGYYWVFANITTSLDVQNNPVGYYSVRRKPNPKAIEIIEPIYQKLLSVEKSGGMDASMKFLTEFLKEKNIRYDEFVINLQRL